MEGSDKDGNDNNNNNNNNNNNDVIDFRALERELRWAAEAERRRGRENDAKLRAVSQRTATFEEFRDIVLASHLTPLSKDDKRAVARTAPWNPLVSAGHRGEDGSDERSVSDAHKLAASAATTAADSAGLTRSI